MPTAQQIKQFLSLTVLPVVAGIASTWLVLHVSFLSAFHLTTATIAGELVQLGTYAIGAALGWLASHHILKGTYAPTAANK